MYAPTPYKLTTHRYPNRQDRKYKNKEHSGSEPGGGGGVTLAKLKGGVTGRGMSGNGVFLSVGAWWGAASSGPECLPANRCERKTRRKEPDARPKWQPDTGPCPGSPGVHNRHIKTRIVPLEHIHEAIHGDGEGGLHLPPAKAE